MLRGKMTKASDVYDALVDAINNVYADVVEGSGSIDGVTHPMEFFLFDNKFKVIEGPRQVNFNGILQTQLARFTH